MNKKLLYTLWGCLYVLCVGLGTVEAPQGLGTVLFFLTSLIFFLPPAILMYHAVKNDDRKVKHTIRILCLVSLGTTLVLLIVNFVSFSMGAQAGKILNDLLILFSAPMFCSQYWVVSLFLWACLLWSSFMKKPQSN